MATADTTADLAAILGQSIKNLRIAKNKRQSALAIQAGVSMHSLQALEFGEGATLNTLIRVLRALGQEDWLKTLGQRPSLNPVQIPTARHTGAIGEPVALQAQA